jgi:hypothetical protein
VRRRFREPVALTEAAVFAVAGAIAALVGPWKWLALAAAPVIFAVVLVIATWPKRAPKRPAPERDVPSLVQRWANQVADHDPARSHADTARQLADGIDDLILQCQRVIARLDGPARQTAEAGLAAVINYLGRSVDTYTATKSAPTRSADWRALADRLKTAHKSLLDELDSH